MTPDPGQRLAAALNELQALGTREMERYLRALCASDPEVAGRLGAMLNIPLLGSNEGTALDAGRTPSSVVPLAEPSRREPQAFGDPTVSADGRGTASFPQPGTPECGETGLPAGQILGRYQLLQVVGRGAFGEVWKAFDPVLEKHVAVKVSRPNRSMPVAAFLDEARKAASLRHDAIVRVHDVCANADGWYIISEFIDGESLRTRLVAGRVPLEQSVRIVASVARALHAAHLAGLVHRDVKPANILLDRAGNAYLIDFGLAVREDEQFAERSRVSGTLAYMPPEQISGDTHLLDGRADIYALGAVLYELLTGRPVFRATDIGEYRELILRREPRPPRAIETTVPEALERVCLKCLAKEVKDRYRTAHDLAADLENWLAGSTRSLVLPPPRGAGRGRWKLAVVGAAAVALVGIVIGVVVLGRGYPQPTFPYPQVDPGAGGAGRQVPTVRELRWDRQNPGNEWKVLPGTGQLKVAAETPSLLGLGFAPGPDWTFAVTFQQLQTVGGVGLFLGHRVEGKYAIYELVSLVWNKHAVNPRERIWLQRAVEYYPPDVPSEGPKGGVLDSAPVGPGVRENTIRVTVQNNQVSEVHLNGDMLVKIPPGPGRPVAGAFGVYNWQSECLVSNPRLNDNPIRLLVDLGPQTPERP